MSTDSSQNISDNVAFLVLLTCLGYASFNIADTLIKMIGDRFHVTQVVFLHTFVQFVLLLAYGVLKGDRKIFTTKKPKLVLLRSVFGVMLISCVVFSLPHLELTTFYTIAFTSPFWIVVISSIFLDDPVRKASLGVTIFGFLVILAVFRPSSGNLNLWSAVMLLGAFCSAGQWVTARKIGKNENRFFLVLAGNALATLVFLPFMPVHYIAPTPYEWVLFVGSSIGGITALFLLFYAFQHAPSAVTVAPYHYTQMIWGALLGYLVFGDVPSMDIMIGAVLITLAGLFLIYSENKAIRRTR